MQILSKREIVLFSQKQGEGSIFTRRECAQSIFHPILPLEDYFQKKFFWRKGPNFHPFNRMTLDVSLFGPLHFFHLTRESCVIIIASAFAELTLDRYFATIDPEKYEQQKRPYLSIFLLLIVYIYVGVIQTLRYLGFISMLFMPIMLGVISVMTIPILMWIFKKNQQYLSSKDSFSLNKKFQVRFLSEL
jgi:hypothetical protein